MPPNASSRKWKCNEATEPNQPLDQFNCILSISFDTFDEIKPKMGASKTVMAPTASLNLPHEDRTSYNALHPTGTT
jgi:hypothetical protein